jgi:hypothetical protein
MHVFSSYIIELELQIVCEMLRVNTGSSCMCLPQLSLGSWAVFRIVMRATVRATNEGHCEGH